MVTQKNQSPTGLPELKTRIWVSIAKTVIIIIIIKYLRGDSIRTLGSECRCNFKDWGLRPN